MLIVTTEQIVGKEIIEVKGMVSGSTIQSKNMFADIGSGLKTLVGGELNSYTDMMEKARTIATDRMIDNAKKIGANAIVSVKITSSTIVGGAAEILVYGTAVIIK